MRVTSSTCRNVLLAVATIAVCAAPAFAQRRGGFGTQEGFRFRWVGPIVGNRVAAIAGVAGRPQHLLRGSRFGRGLEVDRRRKRLDADFRQRAGAGDRRAGGRAVRSQHRLGGNRRSLGDPR